MYLAVLTYTAEKSLERIPMGGEDTPGASAQDRLASFITSSLGRLLDDGRPAWFGKLVAREMFEPTEALDKVARMFATPQFERLKAIVSELLGPAAEPGLVRRCCFSIFGQCLYYKHARPMVERLAPEQGFTAADRAVLADHITRFTLAGLAGVRAQATRGSA